MYKIEFIVLAGFLWLIPERILDLYKKRVINIHPALLPDYGGKGMYGEKVHEAVIRNHEKESGITIHYVNKDYDKGDIIFQAGVKIVVEILLTHWPQRCMQLEYKHYPKIIEELGASCPICLKMFQAGSEPQFLIFQTSLYLLLKPALRVELQLSGDRQGIRSYRT